MTNQPGLTVASNNRPNLFKPKNFMKIILLIMTGVLVSLKAHHFEIEQFHKNDFSSTEYLKRNCTNTEKDGRKCAFISESLKQCKNFSKNHDFVASLQLAALLLFISLFFKERKFFGMALAFLFLDLALFVLQSIFGWYSAFPIVLKDVLHLCNCPDGEVLMIWCSFRLKSIWNMEFLNVIISLIIVGFCLNYEKNRVLEEINIRLHENMKFLDILKFVGLLEFFGIVTLYYGLEILVDLTKPKHLAFSVLQFITELVKTWKYALIPFILEE
jgi:hypothetical protein